MHDSVTDVNGNWISATSFRH